MRWIDIEVRNRTMTRRKTSTNRFINDAFPFYLPIISKRQLVRKLSTFLDYTTRQVKMLIDSRSRLERIRKLQRRLRSLFAEVTSKGIGREILARSQYAWLGHVLEARHTASKLNVRADFAIKSDDHNRSMHATTLYLLWKIKMKKKSQNLINLLKKNFIYWVVRKVRADVEGKLKRRKFKF